MTTLKTILAAALFLAVASHTKGQYIPVEPNPYGDRPIIVPIPSSNNGDTQVITIKDNWESLSPATDGFWKDAFGTKGDWKPYVFDSCVWDLPTPNMIVAYRNKTIVPESFNGKRTIIRFDGTAHDASLWINGKFVRKHWGSYGSWTADITDFVKPGEEAVIALSLDQRPNGLAAFVRFSAGIHGDVKLYSVNEQHIQRLRLDIDLDDQYKDAILQVWLRTSTLQKGFVRVKFTNAKGKTLAISPSEIELPDNMQEFKYNIAVKNPLKWDAEHPNLYNMTIQLLDGKKNVVETIERKYGFREVERKGQHLFVNGDEVKFRGIWGVDDAKKMREINVNHVRHKYMNEHRLNECDKYGVYVLHENSVDFAKLGVESDPKFAYQWMDLIADMMERDYNHPSVVMWGLGNESFSGPNILPTHKYVHNDDPTRPTMFSWSNRIDPAEEIPYDVFSYHYPAIAKPDIDLSDYGTSIWHSESLIKKREQKPELPVLADEAFHVCISQAEAQRDPNVRNFWGESAKHFWDIIWNTPGSLGGDQFGIFTDLPKWNLPEPWLLRKAYSPFVIKERTYDLPEKNRNLSIEVENRFCHTNLRELKIYWEKGNEHGVINGPDLKPFETGRFEIPCKAWNKGDRLSLTIKDSYDFVVDEYILDIAPAKFTLPEVSKIPAQFVETESDIIVTGKDFKLTMNKAAGQISSAEYKGKVVLCGGPHLQFEGSNLAISEYWPNKVTCHLEGNEAVIDMDVIYSPIKALLQLRIDGEGVINVNYTITHFPDPAPMRTTIPWAGADWGGFREVGVLFYLPNDVDRLKWDRRGLWSVYPEDHIGREQGVAYKESAGLDQTQWQNLSKDFNWMGYPMAQSTVTNDFRASKEYIRTATALLKDCEIGIQAMSEETDAVRIQPGRRNQPLQMIINNLWNYPTLGVGNWMKPSIIIEDGYKNSVHIRMVDFQDN